jgi:hypothetical protein
MCFRKYDFNSLQETLLSIAPGASVVKVDKEELSEKVADAMQQLKQIKQKTVNLHSVMGWFSFVN